MRTNSEQVMPFIFKILPTQLCHSHLIEHYILQWMDIQTLNPVKFILILFNFYLILLKVGSLDLLRINHCFRYSENCFKINADIKTDDGPGTISINYEIECNIADDCHNYVTALNHVSQLVKCKIFSYKTNYDNNALNSKK